MIQGGGFTADLAAKTARGPIKNEADNGLTNVAGTIAMARTREPHSATSQFFINVVDNPALNFSAPADGSYGYCVFGKVVKGMEVANKISKVATGPQPPHQNAPLQPVIIERVRLMNAPTKPAK
jgi:peptidyl-prolyl cis-trans isomerase B (cyclophilin B)